MNRISFDLLKKGTAITGVLLVAAMLSFSSCEEEGGGLTKCEQLDGSSIGINDINAFNDLKSKILDYVECGKEVEVVINFSMPMKQGDLDDPKDWRRSPNITLIFGDKGAICPADANVTLTFAKFEELGFPKIVANPNGGNKFKVVMGDRQDFLDKLGNLDALLVIGDDPSQDGDSIVIRNASEIAEKVNLAVKQAAEKGTANVVIMYDIGIETKDVESLNELLDENITVTGNGKIFATINAIVVTPTLLNKIPYTNKNGLNNLFKLVEGSNKYLLPDGSAHVLVDSVFYWEDGRLLKQFLPERVYFNTDQGDVAGFEAVKDYTGKINIVMMKKDLSALTPYCLPENSFGRVNNWFADAIHTKTADGTGNLYTVDETGVLTDPFMTVYKEPSHFNNPAITPTGDLTKGTIITKLTNYSWPKFAQSFERAAQSRTNISAHIDGRFHTYPVFAHNNLVYEYTPEPEYMNTNTIISRDFVILDNPNTVMFVGSSIIEGLATAIGCPDGGDRFSVYQTFPIPDASYGPWNTMSVNGLGLVIENDFVKKHDQLSPYVGNFNHMDQSNVSYLIVNEQLISVMLGAGVGINHLKRTSVAAGLGEYRNGGTIPRYFEHEAAAINQKFKKASAVN